MQALRSFFGGEAAPALPKVEKLTPHSDSAPQSVKVKAEEYVTPEKYLDGAAIPTYYQFQSNIVSDEDLKPGMIRQLEVDKRLTVPTRTHIRFLAVPSLGMKTDATPGRLNKLTAFIQREGVFYGQCSELCGTLHGFMPIVIEAVSPETYAAHARKWYKE